MRFPVCGRRGAGSASRRILLGIIPGGGGTQRLARLIGPAGAKDIVLTGRYVSAEEALGIGLVDRVLTPESVGTDAIEFASRLAAGAMVAQGLAKRAIDEGLELSLADGLSLERELFARTFATRDAEIGVRSFLERGPGRRSSSAPELWARSEHRLGQPPGRPVLAGGCRCGILGAWRSVTSSEANSSRAASSR